MASAPPLAVSVNCTALQQRINVALSFGLLKAILGYDLIEEAAVTRQRGKVLFGELTPLRADFLEHLLGRGSRLRLCSSRVGCLACRCKRL